MPDQKRTERVVIRLTPDEKQTLDALSGGNGRQHARDLILQESGTSSQVLHQLHAFALTLNEALSVLIEESEGQASKKLTCQLSALRDAMKQLQRQAQMETSISVQEILQQLHDAVGGDKLA
jgi:hypothetical protein